MSTSSKAPLNPKIVKRNERLKKRWRQLTEKKFLRNDKALEILEEEFITLEQSSIWLIISETGYYKKYATS